MVEILKVRKLGRSLGVFLSEDMLRDLGVGEGDLVYPTRTANGVTLTSVSPEEAGAHNDDQEKPG